MKNQLFCKEFVHYIYTVLPPFWCVWYIIAKVYSLPGTIPCNICGNGLGLGMVEKPKNEGVIGDPAPNPSNGQTKLSFTLPEGTKTGKLSIYSNNGELVKTFKVDNTFGYITIDNSMMPAGIYFYNLVADDNVTLTKKMVVIK